MKNFEKFVEDHSIDNDLLYNSNALCGEVGEVANVVKKIQIRNKLKPVEIISMKSIDEYNSNLIEELGDCLFYLTKITNSIGLTLDDIMDNQCTKISNQDTKYGRKFLK